MTCLLGINPGHSGALAVVETIGGIPVLLDAIDMPVIGANAKARVDVTAAAEWIARHAPSTAYVERAQAFPGQGASSGFLYGRSVGTIETVAALCRVPFVLVEVSAWKKKLHLPGKDKELARQRTLRWGRDCSRPPIEVPQPEIDTDAPRQALVSFDDDWAAATRALIARKAYGGGAA